jgi:hypothetical protein
MNGAALDHEGERAALIARVVGQRCIGLAQGVDHKPRMKQAPQIGTGQQHDLARHISWASSHGGGLTWIGHS